MANPSVEDLVTIIRVVHHFKGKHIKQLLTELESLGALTPEVRKAVLDNFNEYARSVLLRLGNSIDT